MEIRVLIFEDNRLVREALTAIINGIKGYTCCGSYANGDQWDTHISFHRPSIILMDIEMPGKDGILLTSLITHKYPEVKILIQTVFADHDKIFKALCSGASGYILKGDPPHRLVSAIEEILQGGAPLSAPIATKVLGFFTSRNVILTEPTQEEYHLSPREKEILSLMVEGFDLHQIANQTYTSYETVRTHVKKIYRKLHVASRHEAVTKAIQQRIVKKNYL